MDGQPQQVVKMVEFEHGILPVAIRWTYSGGTINPSIPLHLVLKVAHLPQVGVTTRSEFGLLQLDSHQPHCACLLYIKRGRPLVKVRRRWEHPPRAATILHHTSLQRKAHQFIQLGIQCRIYFWPWEHS